MKMNHVVELGSLGLECLMYENLQLGRVCHCIAATLATLAAHNHCADLIVGAEDDVAMKAVLALVDVEDDNFEHANHVRAAACTCLAFLACHPLGAKGDACLTGPYR